MARSDNNIRLQILVNKLSPAINFPGSLKHNTSSGQYKQLIIGFIGLYARKLFACGVGKKRTGHTERIGPHNRQSGIKGVWSKLARSGLEH